MRLQAYMKEAVRLIQLVSLYSKLKLPVKYPHTVSCVFIQNFFVNKQDIEVSWLHRASTMLNPFITN